MIREDLVRRLAGGEKPFDYDIDRIFDHYVSLDKKRRKAKNGPRRIFHQLPINYPHAQNGEYFMNFGAACSSTGLIVPAATASRM